MSFIKRNIPNAITCGNLLCGCLALVKAFEGDLVWAAYLVGIALVLDFFDGFTARLLKASSPIGGDLDSLADMVTFGVVPGVVMFQMIRISLGDFSVFPRSTFVPGSWNTYGEQLDNLIPYIAFLIPLLSAIRLAKFNNDTRQSDSFIGVPTPANAILLCSLGLILFSQFFSLNLPTQDLGEYTAVSSKFESPNSFYLSDIYIGSTKSSINIAPSSFPTNFILNPIFLFSLTIIMSLLLVAELPLIALKFKHFKWRGNEIRFILIMGTLVLLATLQLVGIPLSIVFYILLSIINNILTKRKGKLPN